MKRARTGVCWLLASSTSAWSLPATTAAAAVPAVRGLVRVDAAVRVDPLSVPRLLQTATPSNDTAVDSSSGSAALDNESRAAAAAAATTTPPDQVNSAPTPSDPTTDNRIVTDVSYRRGSTLSVEGIIGIIAGVIAAFVLGIAFVRAGSSTRKLTQQQEDEQQAASAMVDLASSTMSIKDVKYVDSFDSPAVTPRASIASIRKPSVPLRSQQLCSGEHASDRHAGPAPSLEYTITNAEPEQLFTPSRVRTLSLSLSRSQRSASDRRESLQRAPLSPESYLKLAQSTSRNPFAQSRRSRHSRATSREAPSPHADSSSSLPLPAARRPSRLRFSRSSIQSTDSASEIPMLDDYRGGTTAAPPRRDHSDECTMSPRDIPVLARGSEESVDSVEDEDIEISI